MGVESNVGVCVCVWEAAPGSLAAWGRREGGIIVHTYKIAMIHRTRLVGTNCLVELRLILTKIGR